MSQNKYDDLRSLRKECRSNTTYARGMTKILVERLGGLTDLEGWPTEGENHPVPPDNVNDEQWDTILKFHKPAVARTALRKRHMS